MRLIVLEMSRVDQCDQDVHVQKKSRHGASSRS